MSVTSTETRGSRRQNSNWLMVWRLGARSGTELPKECLISLPHYSTPRPSCMSSTPSSSSDIWVDWSVVVMLLTNAEIKKRVDRAQYSMHCICRFVAALLCSLNIYNGPFICGHGGNCQSRCRAQRARRDGSL